ncbi:MAG TPA: A24 family peptidase [Terriglobia bacterium]|jgi:prepilin peptidase CpaA|nr:A24 family peptidase [Terriglobia bacterium]
MHDPMWNEVAIWALGLLVALGAGWLDWRFRRIPNWLTVSGFFAGLGMNGILSGWSGVLKGLEGAGIGLAVLILPVIFRGMGAGDLKLMGALGACLGPRKFLIVLFISIFISGIMSIVAMVRKRRVKKTLGNMAVLIRAFATFGMGAREALVTLDTPDALPLPFGVATAFAVVIVVLAKSTFGIF